MVFFIFVSQENPYLISFTTTTTKSRMKGCVITRKTFLLKRMFSKS